MLVKNLYSCSNEVQLCFVCNKSKIGYKQKGGFRYRNPPCDSHGVGGNTIWDQDGCVEW